MLGHTGIWEAGVRQFGCRGYIARAIFPVPIYRLARKGRYFPHSYWFRMRLRFVLDLQSCFGGFGKLHLSIDTVKNKCDFRAKVQTPVRFFSPIKTSPVWWPCGSIICFKYISFTPRPSGYTFSLQLSIVTWFLDSRCNRTASRNQRETTICCALIVSIFAYLAPGLQRQGAGKLVKQLWVEQ